MTIEFTTVEKLKRFKNYKLIKFMFDGNFVYVSNEDETDTVAIDKIQTISNHRGKDKIEIFTDFGNICIKK